MYQARQPKAIIKNIIANIIFHKISDAFFHFRLVLLLLFLIFCVNILYLHENR